MSADELPPHDADCPSCNRRTSMVMAVAAYCDEGGHPVNSIYSLHRFDGRELCVEHLRVSAPKAAETVPGEVGRRARRILKDNAASVSTENPARENQRAVPSPEPSGATNEG